MARTPRFVWRVRAGDFEGYTFDLPSPLGTYTDWASTVRAAPQPAEADEHEVGIDDSLLPDSIRIFIEGTDLTAAMDGWTGDIQSLDTNGKPFTIAEYELKIEDHYTP